MRTTAAMAKTAMTAIIAGGSLALAGKIIGGPTGNALVIAAFFVNLVMSWS